jgi:hypothetical protein
VWCESRALSQKILVFSLTTHGRVNENRYLTIEETQARPIAIGREMFVDQFGHTHLQEKCDDDRNIVCSLVGDCDLFAHSTSLSQFLFSRENSHEL